MMKNMMIKMTLALATLGTGGNSIIVIIVIKEKKFYRGIVVLLHYTMDVRRL